MPSADLIALGAVAATLATLVASASTSVELTISVDEELLVGSELADLTAALRARGHRLPRRLEPWFRIFNAAPSSVGKYFALAGDTGRLSVGQRLDRDRMCADAAACCDRLTPSCRFTLQVQSDREYTYVVSVEVTLNDINDNAPRWSIPELMREFSEASAPGEFRTLPPAEDPDAGANSVRSYRLLPPLHQEFELQQEASPTGDTVLRLRLLRPLDREVRDSYRLTLAAYDGGLPARNGTVVLLITVADENDEQPRFEQQRYSASVREDATPGAAVLHVKAIDRDAGANGQVTYSIPAFAPARIRSLFSVDPVTGAVRVAGQLDYEQHREHRFAVQAQDRSPTAPRQGTTVVTISILDVNDEAPRILFNTERPGIAENEPPRRTITIVTATDADSGVNGQVTCWLQDSQSAFTLESLNPEGPPPWLYKLVTARALDRESDGAAVRVVIRCRDFGQPSNTAERSLRVDVMDVNDNVPHFNGTAVQHFSINERTQPRGNSPDESFVFCLAAEDPDAGANGTISYEMADATSHANFSDADAAQFFELSLADGRVRLRQRLDREVQARHRFVALAVDAGQPARLTGSVFVTVEVTDDNDNCPMIAPCLAFHVAEDAASGTIIGRLNASDADSGNNARLSFQLAAQTEATDATERHFNVTPDGLLVLLEPVDRERTRRFQFSVEVADAGQPQCSAFATVVVEVDDVNDSRPRFLFPSRWNRTVHLPAVGIPVAGRVAQLLAVDPDADANGRLRFSLLAPADSPFHVDEDTGQVILVRPLVPELAARPIRLTLMVRDCGQPPLEDVQSLVVEFIRPELVLSSDGDGGNGAGSSGANDGFLVIAGLVFVTAAFLLILVTGLLLIACRRRCTSAAAIAGRSNRSRRSLFDRISGKARRGGSMEDEATVPMTSRFYGGQYQQYRSHYQQQAEGSPHKPDFSSLLSTDGCNEDSSRAGSCDAGGDGVKAQTPHLATEAEADSCDRPGPVQSDSQEPPKQLVTYATIMRSGPAGEVRIV